MSENLDDLLQTFGRESDDDKQENFEASTVKLIAKQLGLDRNELPDSCWVDWLEDLDVIPGRIFCQRVFTFKFEDLLFKPTGHVIVNEYASLGVSDEDVTWVFKVYGYGRMVCTTIQPAVGSAYASVPNPLDESKPLFIQPFAGYFRRYSLDC